MLRDPVTITSEKLTARANGPAMPDSTRNGTSFERVKDSKFPAIPPVQSNPGMKKYHCPHCKKTIMQGNVSRLSMVCSNCYKFIRAVETELLHN